MKKQNNIEELVSYKTCPCWSFVPGKSHNCERHCPLVQKNKCTKDYNTDKENKKNAIKK